MQERPLLLQQNIVVGGLSRSGLLQRADYRHLYILSAVLQPISGFCMVRCGAGAIHRLFFVRTAGMCVDTKRCGTENIFSKAGSTEVTYIAKYIET